ncbi:hypothetical protein BKA70DRAFT_1399923 [Coprinopsis sp. MPI-PUGE-AT-0042]|nr:hypothetical protein BKA70DRAFT_1399923 [Coprinopsis sp. MPI-PUGE-AT-0042]
MSRHHQDAELKAIRDQASAQNDTQNLRPQRHFERGDFVYVFHYSFTATHETGFTRTIPEETKAWIVEEAHYSSLLLEYSYKINVLKGQAIPPGVYLGAPEGAFEPHDGLSIQQWFLSTGSYHTLSLYSCIGLFESGACKDWGSFNNQLGHKHMDWMERIWKSKQKGKDDEVLSGKEETHAIADGGGKG